MKGRGRSVSTTQMPTTSIGTPAVCLGDHKPCVPSSYIAILQHIVQYFFMLDQLAIGYET